MSDFLRMKMENMHPIITEALENNGEFVFFPRGKSMLPTIVPEIDMVTLIPPNNIEKYDIVLYKRKNGQYILHRVIKTKTNSFVMCGDNQLSYEKGILQSQLIAKVKCITKPDGSIVECNGVENCNYAKALRKRLYPKHLLYSFKKLIYPLYAALFKRKK